MASWLAPIAKTGVWLRLAPTMPNFLPAPPSRTDAKALSAQSMTRRRSAKGAHRPRRAAAVARPGPERESVCNSAKAALAMAGHAESNAPKAVVTAAKKEPEGTGGVRPWWYWRGRTGERGIEKKIGSLP